jgi:hypothetical protein
MNTTLTKLGLEFKIGHCNGTMRMQMFIDDIQIADYFDIESDLLEVEHQFMWPATLKLVLSDKNLSSDTKIDNDGKIVADKFIELTKIYIDGVDANIEFMQRIVLNTNEEKIKTCYWGFNGTVEIAFDLIDSFAWHLRQRAKQNEVDMYVQPIKKI